MADYPKPGNNVFDADQEKAMRAGNRVPLPQPDPRGPPVQIGSTSTPSRPSTGPTGTPGGNNFLRRAINAAVGWREDD